MAGVPYVFGNATTSIPLTNLDANFNTGLTIGNTTVGLGNTVTTLGNVTIANATTISAGNIRSYVSANNGAFICDGSSSGNPYYGFSQNGTLQAYLQLTGSGSSTNLIFSNQGAEAMRIDYAGNLLVGCTTFPSSSATSGTGFGVYGAGGSIVQNMAGSPEGVSYNYTTYSSGVVYPIVFRTNGAVRGYISYNGTIVSYVSTSDERLKTNIVDSSSALNLINAIKVRQFNWIENDFLEPFGFIAQELNNVYPTAISEGDNNKDGTVYKPWGVDPSKLVPMLVKAIQELNAKVDAQALEIATLKAK